MSDKLKTKWTRVAFGDVVKLCRERSSDLGSDGFDRYVGLEHLDPGDLKIRRWGNVADGTTFTSVFRAGQVLFGKRRSYQRKLAVPDFDGVCSGDIYVFEPKNDRLLPKLLPFICQTDGFFDHAVGTSAGSLSPRTNWQSLASYEFALPPLDEQRRVAEVMGAMTQVREKLRFLHEATISSLDSLADYIFCNFPCANRISDFCVVNPEGLSQQQLASTEVWNYADLSSVSFPMRLLKLQNICLRDAPSRAQRIARNGDILVSTVRPNLKGHVIITGQEKSIVASTGFAVLRPYQNEHAPILMGAILSSRFLQHCDGCITGTAYPAIRPRDVAAFAIPDLSLLSEQGFEKLFASLVDKVHESLQRQEQFSNMVASAITKEVLSI
jgi:hypothetical protein